MQISAWENPVQISAWENPVQISAWENPAGADKRLGGNHVQISAWENPMQKSAWENPVQISAWENRAPLRCLSARGRPVHIYVDVPGPRVPAGAAFAQPAAFAHKTVLPLPQENPIARAPAAWQATAGAQCTCFGSLLRGGSPQGRRASKVVLRLSYSTLSAKESTSAVPLASLRQSQLAGRMPTTR